MSYQIGEITILNCVLCEDIRKEVSQKEILIGVYSGDIVTKNYPAQLNLVYWLQHFTSTAGDHSFEVRLINQDQAEFAMIKAGFNAKRNNALGSLGVGLPFQAQRDDEILFQARKSEEDEWVTIHKVGVFKAESIQKS